MGHGGEHRDRDRDREGRQRGRGAEGRGQRGRRGTARPVLCLILEPLRVNARRARGAGNEERAERRQASRAQYGEAFLRLTERRHCDSIQEGKNQPYPS
jgi:hypothetical protein